jgi:hypothetical protein
MLDAALAVGAEGIGVTVIAKLCVLLLPQPLLA